MPRRDSEPPAFPAFPALPIPYASGSTSDPAPVYGPATVRANALATRIGQPALCPVCRAREYVKRTNEHLQCADCRDARGKRYDALRARAADNYEPRTDGQQALNRRSRFAQR